MKRTVLLLALTMMTLLPQAASAQDNDKSEKAREATFDKRVFGGPLGNKATACFVRHYDTSHLTQHPKQKVAAMNNGTTGTLTVSGGQAGKSVLVYLIAETTSGSAIHLYPIGVRF